MAKFEEKWKALKELEWVTTNTISNLEKEKAVLEEKLENVESKLYNEINALKQEL